MENLKIQPVLVLGVLLVCLAWARADAVGSGAVAQGDIFQWGTGIEQPIAGQPRNRNHDSESEFLPYSKAFQREAGEMVFRVPEGDAPQRYR